MTDYWSFYQIVAVDRGCLCVAQPFW